MSLKLRDYGRNKGRFKLCIILVVITYETEEFYRFEKTQTGKFNRSK